MEKEKKLLSLLLVLEIIFVSIDYYYYYWMIARGFMHRLQSESGVLLIAASGVDKQTYRLIVNLSEFNSLFVGCRSKEQQIIDCFLGSGKGMFD